MPREEIETYISAGSSVRVEGKRTATEGRYKGVGLTEDGEPSIVVEVEHCSFAYRLDEVSRIVFLSPATTGRADLERAESPPERSYRLVDRERVQAAIEQQREGGDVVPGFVQRALDEAFGETVDGEKVP